MLFIIFHMEFINAIKGIVLGRFQKLCTFFDLRLSNNSNVSEDAFCRHLIETEEYEKAALHCDIDKPVFQSDVVDREVSPRQERTRKSDLHLKTDIVKQFMFSQML